MPQNISHTETLGADVRRFRELLVTLARRHTLRDPIAAHCGSGEITHTQFHALLWLGHDGRLTMGELARRLAVTEKTITGLVDRMEREGHLQRERDAADRRVVRVLLTPKGIETFRQLDAEVEHNLASFLELLDPPDRQHLLRILQKLNDRLNPNAENAAK